jgi:hypothetical protein
MSFALLKILVPFESNNTVLPAALFLAANSIGGVLHLAPYNVNVGEVYGHHQKEYEKNHQDPDHKNRSDAFFSLILFNHRHFP